MKAIRIAVLIYALTGLSSAQTGTVVNAALYQPVLNLIENPFILVTSVFSESIGVSANIVSPRMLAVLSYSIPVDIFDPVVASLPMAAPVTATLSMRPVGSSVTTPLTVTNAVAGAITFVVPSSFPVGGAELLYQINGGTTQWTNVDVVPSSFEFFRSSLGGPAIAQISGAQVSSANVGLATPAQPGETLLLTGSGLGNNATVSATIGGVAATVTFAGAYPAQLGRDEVLLQIPSGVPDGCYVPVVFTYNTATVSTTISKTSDGSPCKHPWQLSVNDLKTLDSGGTLEASVVSLSSELTAVTSAIASRDESAGMTVSPMTGSQIAAYFPASPVSSGPSCTGVTLTGLPSLAFVNGDFSGLSPAPVVPDLGSTITLKNPAASITLAGEEQFGDDYSSVNIPPPTDGSLNNLPTSLPGGKWTWQSNGGKDLPASSFGFTLPSPIQLSLNAPLSMRRDQDQTITWNGSAFDTGATVGLYIDGTTAQVSCIAPASIGTLTIPASLLSGLTANTIATLTANLNESGPFLPHAQFQLQNGTTLLMVVSFSSSDSRAVSFQ